MQFSSHKSHPTVVTAPASLGWQGSQPAADGFLYIGHFTRCSQSPFFSASHSQLLLHTQPGLPGPGRYSRWSATLMRLLVVERGTAAVGDFVANVHKLPLGAVVLGLVAITGAPVGARPWCADHAQWEPAVIKQDHTVADIVA